MNEDNDQRHKAPLPYSGPFLGQGYHGDAGFDLAASERHVVPSREYSLIPCDVQVELPEGVFAWIVSRSSTFQRYGLIVLPGLIDTGYRGKLFVAAYNLRDDHDAVIEKNARVGQLVLFPNVAQQYQPIRVQQIRGDSHRGDNGFGSTGR